MAKYASMEVEVLAQTGKAVKVNFFPGTRHEKELWVPLSVLEDAEELENQNADAKCDLSIAKWFMEKNNIEYDMDDDDDEWPDFNDIPR